MINIAFLAAALWTPSIQLAQTLSLRIGDIAKQLTDQDIVAIDLALLPEKRTWLLHGEPLQFGTGQFISAYLPPTTTTPELRRGVVIGVQRLLSRLNGWTAWTASAVPQPYAQVAIPGRSLDEIGGDRDVNRPFRVFGDFADTELLALLKSVRSSSIWSLPVWKVVRGTDGSADILLLDDAQSGPILRARQTGQNWLVVQAGYWGA